MKRLTKKAIAKRTKQLEEEKVKKLGETVVDHDMVNHPPHYNAGSIEIIDFIDDQEHLDYHCKQSIRYVTRSPFKGTEIQDLEKAVWYLNRKVKQLKEVANG